jgi:hypothetical protein
MGLCISIPVQQSLNDEIREIEHLTYLEKVVNNNKKN